MNGTMFNVAIPTIGEQFQLTPSEVSWVISGYIVIFALGSITYGKLADMYPVKNLITVGLVLFNLGSLLGFISTTYWMLIIARIVQASGAAAIPALGMITATRYFPPQSKGKVLGAIASTVSFGAGIGPILGGFVAGALNWHYLFLISLFSLPAIYFLRKLLPVEKANTQLTFDLKGAVLLGIGITGLLLFLTELHLMYLVFGLLLLGLFVLHIRKEKNPFIQPHLFLNKQYRNALLTGFLAVATVFGMMFLVPIMLKDQNGLSSMFIGLVMFPGAISAAIFGTVSGRMADRIGSVPIVTGGLGLIGIGYFLMSIFAGSHFSMIAAVLIICYIGFSTIQSSLANTVSNTLNKENLGIGMGLYNLIFFMSGAFGATTVGKVLDLSEARVKWNPFAVVNQTGVIYSNIFVVLLITIAISFTIYYTTFSLKQKTLSEAK